MTKIFPREIGIVIANNKLAKEVFEQGMGLTLKHVNPTSRIYQLNEQTRLNVWTDGQKHPLFSQEYLQLFADEQTILHTARALRNWSSGVTFKRSQKGHPFVILSINLPEGSHISLSDQDWSLSNVDSN